MKVLDYAYTTDVLRNATMTEEDCQDYCDDVVDNFLFWEDYTSQSFFCCELSTFSDNASYCTVLGEAESYEEGDVIARMDNVDDSDFVSKT